MLRVRFPSRRSLHDAVLDVEGLGERRDGARTPTGTGADPAADAVPAEGAARQRFGVPYPYEIVRMLTPPAGAVARFPTGQFVEHDLDEQANPDPGDRDRTGSTPPTSWSGCSRNDTAKVPEGMTRVALLGDPTRGLGNLAEPECRRIIAALDLAERMRCPVEWFALSSGALIAMDSGTENMDWIAAVLRRADRVHPARRRGEHRRHRRQRRRPAVLERRGDDADAHPRHPGDDCRPARWC